MEPTTEVLDFEEMFLDDADTMAIEEDEAKDNPKEAKDTPVRRDNRDLKDENSSQKLKKEDIEELKSEGRSGEQILASLIENSESFNKKTKFSQVRTMR